MTIAENTLQLTLPKVRPGRPGKEALAERALLRQQILNIRSTVDFSFSSRGWCYAAEKFGVMKNEFDRFEKLMDGMRDRGKLPLNITDVDKSREFWCSESLDYPTAKEEAKRIRRVVKHCVDTWTPFSFWDDKEVFLVVLVEKVDLVNLFKPVCGKYRIPIANAKGWSDKHVRAELILKCRPHLEAGRRVVVLYCGDFDPGGLQISDRLFKNLLDLDGTYYDLSLSGGNGHRDVSLKPGEIEIVRFGLNYDLIESLGLSWVDNLRTSKPTPPNELNDPRHADFKKPYVQNYIRDYCNGYKKDGYYHTDSPRKCEANALLFDIEAGRQLCEEAIQEQLQDPDCVEDHEAELNGKRTELRELVNGDK